MPIGERLLKNPGLVENGPDGASCFHACIQMAMRTKSGGHVYSFQEIDAIQKRSPGFYSWEYAMLDRLSQEGFLCEVISAFSLERFVREGAAYLIEYFGEASAKDQIEHTEDLAAVIDFARQYMMRKTAKYDERIPTLDDVRTAIDNGWYLIPTINQRILQADPDFAMHSVFAYGYSERGVRIHNPGPPATEASEIAWDLFEKTWSSPKESSRQMIKIKSCHKDS